MKAGSVCCVVLLRWPQSDSAISCLAWAPPAPSATTARRNWPSARSTWSSEWPCWPWASTWCKKPPRRRPNGSAGNSAYSGTTPTKTTNNTKLSPWHGNTSAKSRSRFSGVPNWTFKQKSTVFFLLPCADPGEQKAEWIPVLNATAPNMSAKVAQKTALKWLAEMWVWSMLPPLKQKSPICDTFLSRFYRLYNFCISIRKKRIKKYTRRAIRNLFVVLVCFEMENTSLSSLFSSGLHPNFSFSSLFLPFFFPFSSLFLLFFFLFLPLRCIFLMTFCEILILMGDAGLMHLW